MTASFGAALPRSARAPVVSSRGLVRGRVASHRRRVRAPVVSRRRRIRERIAPRREGSAFAAVGKLVVRLVPAARAMPVDLAGRAAVYAALGAIALGGSRHGTRALAGAAVGVVGGWRAAVEMQRRVVRASALQTARELPAVLDRLTTCVLAGMSVEKGLRLVAPGTRGVIGEAIREGLRALDAGVPRTRAYAIVANISGSDDVRALTTSLTRAERYGTSVSTALIAHAHEVRARERARAEAAARTAPVKMIFPLVFCFLPAFVLLTIAPIALSAIRTIGGIR